MVQYILRRSSSVVSNRSTALITDKFSVALLTKPAILNNANVALVDAVHYSVMDALTITLIKDDDDLLGTINSYIKPPLKRCKTEAADSRYAKVSRRRTKKDKDLEDFDTSSDVLRLRRRDRLGKEAQLKKTRDEEELAKAKKEKEEKELIDAYILYFKELLSDNSGIFANAIGIGKTQAIVLAVLIGYFCFFSNSPLENIGRLTKEEVIEMQINTTNAISKALAAANKLFVIVCSFGKVDKYVFRAYNTISGRTIFDEFYNCKLEGIIIAKDSVTGDCIYKIEDARNIIANIKHDASKHESSYKDILEKEGLNKSEASRRIIFNCFEIQVIASYPACKVKRFTLNSVKDLFTNLSKDYFLSIAAEDAAKAANILLLLKEVCAKILIELYKLIVQAVTWLGLREKFSDESVLIIVASIVFAEAIILTEATHVVIIELQDSIVYFNLDSKLELKVLGKQDVKITS
ncbi:hypothetical protein HBH72_233560 [Parastagonospora nodorum]|nr:hypothetical protein HBH72_233560 [Parastagonospora nodorum]